MHASISSRPPDLLLRAPISAVSHSSALLRVHSQLLRPHLDHNQGSNLDLDLDLGLDLGTSPNLGLDLHSVDPSLDPDFHYGPGPSPGPDPGPANVLDLDLDLDPHPDLGPCTFSVLLSLLSWLYSSSRLSGVDPHCFVCCSRDLARLSLLLLSPPSRPHSRSVPGLARSLCCHPVLRSMLGRALGDRGGDPEKAAFHGFTFAARELEQLDAVFLDALALPCRPRFLRDGLLVLDGGAFAFVQDVSEILVPRDRVPGRPIRSYCLLVPSDGASFALYMLLSYSRFVTFNARVVHAGEIGFDGAMQMLAADEIARLSLEASASDACIVTQMARAFRLESRAPEDSPRASAPREYSGTVEGMHEFVAHLLRLKPSLASAPATLTLQSPSFRRFSRLLRLLDTLRVSFMKHSIVVVDDKLERARRMLAGMLRDAHPRRDDADSFAASDQALRIIELD